MRIYKRDQHCQKDLIKIFTKKNIPESFHQRFISYYNETYDDLYEVAECQCIMNNPDFNTLEFEEYYSVNEFALKYTLGFSECYLEQIDIGHGDDWAYLVGNSYSGGEQALSEAYHKLHFENAELAKEELLIHCKFLNADELLANYLLIVFDQKLDYNHPIERANQYISFYKEQIESGKSATYAQQYADLFASSKYTEQYCHAYADLYEYYIKIGESDMQATLSASLQIESNNTGKFKPIIDRLLERHREYFRDNNLTVKEIKDQVNRKKAFFKNRALQDLE